MNEEQFQKVKILLDIGMDAQMLRLGCLRKLNS